MKHGIVLEIYENNASVLTSDGDFRSVKAGRYWQKGDVVSVTDKPAVSAWWKYAGAACLVLLVLGSMAGFRTYMTPVALISLDVNPSIELEVNRLDRIVSASAMNEEGIRILDQAQTGHTGMDEALTRILHAENTGGYLSGSPNIVLTVYSSDADVQSRILEQLQGVLEEEADLYSGQARIECHRVDEATVSGAHGHGVTAGKYLYLQKLKELEPEADLTGYAHHSIDMIKDEIDACRNGHEEKGSGSTNHHAEHHHSE